MVHQYMIDNNIATTHYIFKNCYQIINLMQCYINKETISLITYFSKEKGTYIIEKGNI